ncbi:prespore-specific regulatory protein [Striga asiatica]|uniref:Prespore-specific regulatory protein n=1 Tax=Striga asiatica TaxID=4170 RepID=A0A5A7P9G7_STRAF|nr:prespore-specific regulatory protein [Striga asiatica]
MSSNSYDRDHRYCYCGERSVIRTSWTSKIPAADFVLALSTIRFTEIIRGLLQKSNVLRAENEELREENIRLVECKKKLELEISDWQRELKSAEMIPGLLRKSNELRA